MPSKPKRFPSSALSRDSTPWGRAVEERLVELEKALERSALDSSNANKSQNSSMDLTSQQVVQLNNASETKSSRVSLTSAFSPSSQDARTDYDVALVTFTKPAWANRATILASGTVTASGTQNSPSAFTKLVTRVAGTDGDNFSEAIKAPAVSQVTSGGIPTGEIAYSQSPASTTAPFSRTISVDAATTEIACSVRVSKTFTGASHQYGASIAATVFWFSV